MSYPNQPWGPQQGYGQQQQQQYPQYQQPYGQPGYGAYGAVQEHPQKHPVPTSAFVTSSR